MEKPRIYPVEITRTISPDEFIENGLAIWHEANGELIVEFTTDYRKRLQAGQYCTVRRSKDGTSVTVTFISHDGAAEYNMYRDIKYNMPVPPAPTTREPNAMVFVDLDAAEFNTQEA